MKLSITVDCTPDELRVIAVDYIKQQLFAALVPYLDQEFFKMNTVIQTAADKEAQETASNVALRNAVDALLINVAPLVASVNGLAQLAGNLKAALEQAQQAAQSGQVMSAEDVAAVQTLIATADSEIAANQAKVTALQQAAEQLATSTAVSTDSQTVNAMNN